MIAEKHTTFCFCSDSLRVHACLKSSSTEPDCIGLPLQPGAKLEEEEAKRIFQQVLSAMDYCHRR